MPDRPDSDREVLTSLPRSRPARRSAKRAERPAREAPARASDQPAPPREAETRTPRKPRTPKPAAERPRVPPERKVPPAGYAAPDSRADGFSGSPAAELISTSIQAAAELAQIGLTVGRQTVQSMLERLPKR